MKNHLSFVCLLLALTSVLRADYLIIIGDVDSTKTVRITFDGSTGSRLTLARENSPVVVWTTQSGYNPGDGSNRGNTGSAEILVEGLTLAADGDVLTVTGLPPGSYSVSINEGESSQWYGNWSPDAQSGYVAWYGTALFSDPIEEVQFFYMSWVRHDVTVF